MTYDAAMKRLLANRIILLGTLIDDDAANVVIAQLLFLESEDPAADINLYVNSPGGSVTAAYAIVDAIAGLRPRVSTINLGQCVGMAALILASGARGQRFCLQAASVGLVPLSAGIDGSVDPEARMRQLEFLHRKLTGDLAAATGRSAAVIAQDLARSAWFDASQARDYGFVDGVVDKRP